LKDERGAPGLPPDSVVIPNYSPERKQQDRALTLRKENRSEATRPAVLPIKLGSLAAAERKKQHQHESLEASLH
jgi:hypothetical protein